MEEISRTLASTNLWLCHAEEDLGGDKFEDFVEKILNSPKHVQATSEILDFPYIKKNK